MIGRDRVSCLDAGRRVGGLENWQPTVSRSICMQRVVSASSVTIVGSKQGRCDTSAQCDGGAWKFSVEVASDK